MNPRLLRLYSQELQQLREAGAAFAAEFPKIAGRLGMDGVDCADPYVERLLEGFSFLAARVQLKIDAEFPRFVQHIAEIVYPQMLAPTPSMAVVQMRPDLSNPALAEGVCVPRGSALRSLLGRDDATACEFRTAHDVRLWPIELCGAKLFAYAARQEEGGPRLPAQVRAALRLRLRLHGLPAFRELPLDSLALHLRGSEALPWKLYELLVGACAGVLLMPPAASQARWRALLPGTALRGLGFEDAESLLPAGRRGFCGYRLLQEYFAFPQRFLFIALDGLAAGIRQCDTDELDCMILLDRFDESLEHAIDERNFALHCTPAINLFPRDADRIALSPQQHEFHILPDRTRPRDFEVYQVDSVVGHGAGVDAAQPFEPFYAARDLGHADRAPAYYQLRREPRLASSADQRHGRRSSYVGSEAFLSLVDASEAPYRSELRQLALRLLCTNRDLPIAIPIGIGKTDFILDAAAPVESIRCVAGPSTPIASTAHGDVAWRLLNHLSLNYLSLTDTDARSGALALRELLALYCPANDAAAARQVQGVLDVRAERITRRMPSPGPIAFGRGLKIVLTMDELAFAGGSAFLLGAVLRHFFDQYASVNTFTETVLVSTMRGELMHWPPRSGICATL